MPDCDVSPVLRKRPPEIKRAQACQNHEKQLETEIPGLSMLRFPVVSRYFDPFYFRFSAGLLAALLLGQHGFPLFKFLNQNFALKNSELVLSVISHAFN